MAKNIFQVEIKRIPLEVKLTDLSQEEMTKLALLVEQYMISLQEEGEIDTLKQALQAALFFAAQLLSQGKKTQEQNRKTEERADKLISLLQQSLEPDKQAIGLPPVADPEHE